MLPPLAFRLALVLVVGDIGDQVTVDLLHEPHRTQTHVLLFSHAVRLDDETQVTTRVLLVDSSQPVDEDFEERRHQLVLRLFST